MAYVLPQVQVFQEFTALPVLIVEPLRAFITGPNAELFRYADATEKSSASIGAYDPDNDTTYSYPNRPVGGLVDQGYFKLFGDDVLLEYYEDMIGAEDVIAPVAGVKNKIRAAATNYARNVVGAITYARDAQLLDRDVAVGDIVDISAVVSATLESQRTAVIDIEGDILATPPSAVTSDSNNAVDQTLDAAITKTAGADNCVRATVDASGYNGAVDGDVTETYTVTITQSSVGEDHTTARFRVQTASGNDEATNQTPAAELSPTTVGARGLTITFDTDGPWETSCSVDAEDDNVAPHDLIAGQQWTITVTQDLRVADTLASAGTYTGTTDTTYIIEVTRGGHPGDATKPQITVTTTTGVDISGPTNVTAEATAVAVGTKGITISFDWSGAPVADEDLVAGDRYFITAVADAETNMRTLVLANNLSAALLTASDYNVTLYLPKKQGVQFPRKRTGAAPLVNYDLGNAGVTDTDFEVKAGITAFDPTWTSSGVEQALPVKEATLYAEYRAYVCTKGNGVFTITSDADVTAVPGALSPDNELKWAISKAWGNSNGTEITYSAVCDPSDTAEWQTVIDNMVGRLDVYGIVPLTKTKAILDLFAAHVDAQSTPAQGRWRVMWNSLSVTTNKAVVNSTTSSDEAVVLATLTDDPDASGIQYTIIEVPAANADFTTNGVRAGDILRYNFTTDGWGDETWSEFTIDAVLNEDSLRLQAGQGTVEELVAKKMEVYRTPTKDEQATEIAAAAGAFGNRRVMSVWPDTVGNGGETFSGYFLAAALAGLRSGVAPNQGLTNVEIAGFDDLSRTVDTFNQTQLDTMAESGVWIVTENDSGNIITRHALTTAGFGDVLTQEEMVNANVDSMSFVFLSRTEDLIGRSNVVPGTLDIIKNRIEGIFSFFQEVRIDRIGGQLTDATIIDLRQHSLFKDRVVADIELVVPVPLNNLELHLTIIA
jgi:hypothetical protein